ncbi:RluA family pseudouridine synthase [Pirellulales bacterium]|nr:RluA family pseudouridine synthase [Pirellulales bacterium]
MRLDVLYEDNHLLAVNKPAALPTMGVRSGAPSLLSEAKQYIAEKYDKPGNVYLGIVSRLDAPVTGIVLMARTSKAAARLSAAFRDRAVEKSYLAAVSGEIDPAAATLEHYLCKDERHRRVFSSYAENPRAQFARLSYKTIRRGPAATLLEVALETGRKHQIRVQLSQIGHPIVGDRKYGSELRFEPGIALHAARLTLEHPVRRTPLQIAAPTPLAWHNDKRIGTMMGSGN